MASERLAHWGLYWGVAVNAALAPGMALLFAPVTAMSGRSDLMVRWAALVRLFPVTQRLLVAMIGLAIVGIAMGAISLHQARSDGSRAALPSPNRYTHDAVVALILGALGVLLWGSALVLSLQLGQVYRAWGLSLGLR